MGRRRRFLRILLNAATVASLVLFFTTLALWARSYSVSDRFEWESRSEEGRSSEWSAKTVTWGRGELRHDYRYTRTTGRRTHPTTRSTTFEYQTAEPMETHTRIDGPPVLFERFGIVFNLNDFVYSPWDGEEEKRFNYFVVCPLWILASISAVLPALRAVRWLRRKLRTRTGRCPACGYDLRATPDRCPECGMTSTE